MQNYAQDQYVENQIMTADGGKLVVLLYEGAIQFLNKARDGINESNIEQRSNNIMWALDIIDELRNSLSLSEGGEIAKSLNSLYLFMQKHLISANIKSSAQMIQDVLNMLLSLKEAWEEVASNPEIDRPTFDSAPTTGISV
ncbi:MAG: flagellar export chaperone FliS [Thermodesulfobacteriota bacterium]|nr:flagellar export chaperone FliS [Thermodesulfobacteriota bacterium]